MGKKEEGESGEQRKKKQVLQFDEKDLSFS